MTKVRWFLAALTLAMGAAMTPAHATVTVFLSAGADCNGGNSANFSSAGPGIPVSLCVSSTSEHLCGTSYRFVAGNAAENGKLNIASRAMAPAYNFSNSVNISFPLPINRTASGDLGAGTDTNRPVTPAVNQLIATLEFAPQATATGDAYQISLDPFFASATVDGGDLTCGGELPTSSVPLAANFNFVRSGSSSSAPVFTSANGAIFAAGIANSFLVSATGTPPPRLSLIQGLPADLSFNPTTGVLSGMPTLVGTFPLLIRASNSAGITTQSFTLVVAEVASTAPNIISASTTDFTVGAVNNFVVLATGTPTPTLSISGALPPGVWFDPATGLLRGTPAAAGSFPLVITASNGTSGTSVTQAFTLVVVAGATTAPAITSALGATFTVGAPGSFVVVATGNPTPTLAFSGVLPAGLSFNPVTGLLNGIPTSAGNYPLFITASNDVGVFSQSFMLAVISTPPVTQTTVTAFLAAGTGCHGSNTATYTPGGPAVQVSLCVTATTEHLCGTSYRFVSANATENHRFYVASRTMAPAYNFSNVPFVTFPIATNSTATASTTFASPCARCGW
ncbi:MAG: putative Ig domain-containing protein, partial [Betaproteobacteria bacterium]